MKTLFLGAAIVASAASFGQVTKQGAGYDIKVKYAPGQTINYKINTQVHMATGPGGQPMNQNQATSVSQKVLSIKGGITTLSVQASGPMTNGKSSTVKVDQRGKIVAGNAGMSFMNGFPSRPLRVGESWSSNTPIPQLPGGGNAKVTYTFRGVKSVMGKSVAQIDYSIAMAGQVAMNGKGTSFLTAADGQLVSSSLTATMRISSPQMPKGSKPMNMSLAVTMKRA